jgi:hypothetical protein
MTHPQPRSSAAMQIGTALFLFTLTTTVQAQDSSTSGPQISAAELRAHITYLASDELAGRRVGSEELNRAARYLARELESYGLEPAGDGDEFLQELRFELTRYTALPELSVLDAEDESTPIVYGSDFRVRRPGVAGSYEVRVIGEDSTLPEADTKIALVITGMSSGRAARWLGEQDVPDGRGYGLVVTAMRRANKPTTRLPRASRPRLLGEGEADEVASTSWVELSPATFEDLVASPGARMRFDPHHERLLRPSYNVIARLPARQHEAAETVVVSAHYDHIGTRDAPDSPADEGVDLIFNGADDDASGVACVLEIAQKLADQGPQERELIFLLATAEEIGIVGTRHYLDYPSTPLERTVCNLNFEMLGRPDEAAGGPGKLWLTGAERTNLMEAYNRAGFGLVADPHPEQNFFQRSDNIVFCYRGIVGQTFSTYNLHDDYHQVTDEAERIDYEHLRQCSEAGARAVELVADGTIDPAWLEGGQPKRRR